MWTDDRRSFLKKVFGFFALLVSGNLPFYPLFARDVKIAQNSEDWIAVGKVGDFTDNVWTKITSGRNIIDNKPKGLVMMMLFRQGNDVSVISTRCTHMGCEVMLESDGTFSCPCHGSKFDGNGLVINGPAARPLSFYEVKVTPEGEILLNPGSKIIPPEAV
jgi:nitrite reductase/ring-hydroxylating ferredoxin subunit